MSIQKIKPMPASGEPWRPTPTCESTVQIPSKHSEEWRKERYGAQWNICSRQSTVILDGKHLCRRHAGETVLEKYLEGKLVEPQPTML